MFMQNKLIIMDNRVVEYIEKKSEWKQELIQLRAILNATDLEETIKWGSPFYTYKGKNVVGLSAFKNYFGLWFIQGALLADDKNILMNAQDGKTNAMRQWRMKSLEEIDSEFITKYVIESLKNIDEGKEIKPQKKPLVVPEILKKALSKDKELNTSFESFSLSHKREYADYISEAKREATQIKRLEKIIPMIKKGGGLYDKYKNC